MLVGGYNYIRNIFHLNIKTFRQTVDYHFIIGRESDSHVRIARDRRAP